MANRPVSNNRNGKFRRIQKNQAQLKTKKNMIMKRRTTNPNANVKNVQDARQKILLKKRRKVVDARDVLAKLTKANTQDARSKINKLREHRNGVPSSNGQVKVIGNNILRKTDRNGKISLVTNKTKSASAIELAIQKELGLRPITMASQVRPKKVTMKRNPPVVHQPLRKTIVNDLEYPSARTYNPNVFKWPNQRSAASQIINSLESTRRGPLVDNSWHNYTVTNPFSVNNYVDLDAMEDEEMPMAPRQTISMPSSLRLSNIHSRLDANTPETQGILSQTKTKVVVPVGHRIVVSNLQSSVTQDDIKELFEDVGQLLTAHLVRPGVAEVIYKNLKDAQKAVDTYHNRQLDGQPMKCLLVNKRPINQPTAPALSKMNSESVLIPTRKHVTDHSLVPDISTIHKVLFQRK